MPSILISNSKCTGCRMCEQACSRFHEGPDEDSLSRLTIEVAPDTGAVKGRACMQAACAKCALNCPEGAIERQPVQIDVEGAPPLKGWVLKVNEDKCSNCGTCYDVCPNGVIKEHPTKGVAFKCDLCGGKPQCFIACQDPNPRAVKILPDLPADD
jgi:Fe-S-cluster-containing hydrogenase component 2